MHPYPKQRVFLASKQMLDCAIWPRRSLLFPRELTLMAACCRHSAVQRAFCSPQGGTLFQLMLTLLNPYLTHYTGLVMARVLLSAEVWKQLFKSNPASKSCRRGAMSAALSRSVAALPAPLRRCPPLPSAGGRAGPGAAASRCGSPGCGPGSSPQGAAVRPQRGGVPRWNGAGKFCAHLKRRTSYYCFKVCWMTIMPTNCSSWALPSKQRWLPWAPERAAEPRQMLWCGHGLPWGSLYFGM